MIRLSKDRVLENFFIDDNGVITDANGVIQKQTIYNGRPAFKSALVHRIQMWTKYGWRDGRKWSIHHKDGDKFNNHIGNLVFMTTSEHIKYHKSRMSEETKEKISKKLTGHKGYMAGKKMSEETKKKISNANKGKTYGRIYTPMSEEAKKKIADSAKGRKWYNDGIKNYFVFPEFANSSWNKGMLIKCKQ